MPSGASGHGRTSMPITSWPRASSFFATMRARSPEAPVRITFMRSLASLGPHGHSLAPCGARSKVSCPPREREKARALALAVLDELGDARLHRLDFVLDGRVVLV